jgi:hypothetical protein
LYVIGYIRTILVAPGLRITRTRRNIILEYACPKRSRSLTEKEGTGRRDRIEKIETPATTTA